MALVALTSTPQIAKSSHLRSGGVWTIQPYGIMHHLQDISQSSI